jgi:hypothetical protein
MKLNRTSAWICRVGAAVLFLLSTVPAHSAQIKQGKWFCVEASYNDTLITGFEATFTVKSETRYEAGFTLDDEYGNSIANYQIYASGDTFSTNLPDIQSSRGSGWSTHGTDTIYYYKLNCSMNIWTKAGRTALGVGYPAGASKSRIAFSVQGDSILTLKSPDGRTVLTYTYGAMKILHNPVVFRVQMNVQKKLGNFNPEGGDGVVVRGDFNNWTGNSTGMTEGNSPGVYEATVDFNYALIDTEMSYKFVIVKKGGSELGESGASRKFTLQPHGQELPLVFFDGRARSDVVNAFPLAEGSAAEWYPATAYNSINDEFLVVWNQDQPVNIRGRIFKADGTPHGQPFQIAAGTRDRAYAHVDFNARRNEYLVVWEDYRNSACDVYGVRLRDDGKKLASPSSGADTSFAICTADSSQYSPRVAYNYINNCYLVVWEDYRNSKRSAQMGRYNFDVYGQRLDADGAFLPPGSTQDPKVNFPVANANNYDDFYPDVAYCGNAGEKLNEWLVVFMRKEFGYSSPMKASGGYYNGVRIWGIRVKGNNGAVLDTWGDEVDMNGIHKANGGYEPPWLPEFPIGWDDKDFWGMLPFTQGSPHAESNDDPAPHSVRKAMGARYPIPEFFVAWSDFRNGGDIYGQRVAYFPDSTAFRLKLKNARGPDSLFTAVLVDPNGHWPADPSDWLTWPNYTVTDDPFYQTYNNISYDSDEGSFLVVWNDWRMAGLEDWQSPMPNADIYGQRLWLNPADSTLVWVDHDGNKGVDPALNIPIAFTQADEGNQNYPAIAFGEADNAFLVAYQYTEDGSQIDIYGNLYKGTPLNPTGVDSRERKGTPADFALGQNYPNPFNPDTRIHYALPEGGRVQLKVFDLLGREVATLVDGNRPAGNHMAVWNGGLSDGTQASSGVYVYRLHWSKDGKSVVKNGKMALIR